MGKRSAIGGATLAMAIAMASVLVSCGGGGDAKNTADRDTGARSGSAGRAGGRPAAGAELVSSGQGQDTGQQRILTAELRVRVNNRETAATRAVRVAEAADGLLFSSNADLEGDGDTVLVLKVPPKRFTAILDELDGLGTTLERRVAADDVTDEVVDLEGRLANATASAERLRGLYKGAADVEAVVRIEEALTARETEIETLGGQLRLLRARVELSTVTLRLTERGEPKVSDDIPGFLQGLRSGWVALRNTGGVALTVLGFLLPFLLVLVPFTLVARWAWKRRPRQDRFPPVPPAPQAGRPAWTGPPPGPPPAAAAARPQPSPRGP